MSVIVLYGTETGTSELVADAVVDVLAVEHDASVYDMSEFSAEDLDIAQFVVVVCSTYGEGEFPTGAEPFAEELTDLSPDLTGLRFAVFGLGDSVYEDTFNRGGELMAELFTRHGAIQVGEHARHDYSSLISPSLQAKDWARSLSALIDPVTTN